MSVLTLSSIKNLELDGPRSHMFPSFAGSSLQSRTEFQCGAPHHQLLERAMATAIAVANALAAAAAAAAAANDVDDVDDVDVDDVDDYGTLWC